MAKKDDDDTHFEYRVIVAPCVRLIAGWTIPMNDASAIITAWHRDGFRYTSTRLQLAWGVPLVALRDPAAEGEAEAWYAAHVNGENSADAT